MLRTLKAVVAILLLSAATAFWAAEGETGDAYYRVSLADLTITAGQLPVGDVVALASIMSLNDVVRPYVALTGDAEAYVEPSWSAPWERSASAAIVARAPKDRAVAGTLFLPNERSDGMVKISFEIPASKASDDARRAFLAAKKTHYERLLAHGIPGAALFRHRAFEASRALGERAKVPQEDTHPDRAWGRDEVLDTYDLMSGGRALSENLQLDRLIAVGRGDAPLVDTASLKGITVQDMDWAPLIAGATPRLDSLARCIPADQHALFFPSFKEMADLMDEADAHGTPILELLESRSEDAGTKQFYQRQLCVELTELARTFGPQVVRSVAMTGSDPYLRTGSDVAIIFDAKTPRALVVFIAAKHQLALQAGGGVDKVAGKTGDTAYTGVVSPTRHVCSYMAQFGDTVVVTNSLVQIRRIGEAVAGKEPAIQALPEYVFFRTRYPLVDDESAAFLILSDATIRRWCGPAWRIGNSRRTRAAGLMAEAQAARIEALARGQVTPEDITPAGPVPGGGTLALTPEGVVSSVYNTLRFMTPIAELDLTRVTENEAYAYNRWRDQYQRYWRQYFDPIGAKVMLRDGVLQSDVSVIPLIVSSEYHEVAELTRGAPLDPQAGNAHDALARFVVALNKDSQLMQMAKGFASTIVTDKLGMEPLGWLGKWIEIYADDDPFWEELSKAESTDEFMRQNAPRLPIAVHLHVSDPVKLAVFLSSLRAWVDQTSPGLTVWDTRQHKETQYVRIRPADTRHGDMPEGLAICYATMPDAFVITLNESLLQRTIDWRHAAGEGKDAAPAAPLVGESVAAQMSARGIRVLLTLFGEEYRRRTQVRAWNALPILNELRRICPDADPVALYEQLWHIRLLCPAGGSYRWNEEWQTMESTMLGNPGRQLPCPAMPAALRAVTRGNLGLTFEQNGVRACVQLAREAASGK